MLVELGMFLTVLGTALFGSETLSERAFRLLRWLGNRPEPPGPAKVTPGTAATWIPETAAESSAVRRHSR